MKNRINLGATLTHSVQADSPDPAMWWRRVCWVTDRVALSGDLHDDDDRAAEQLAEWAQQGVTHILDVREEAMVSWETARIGHLQPDMTYFNLGTHDNGGEQDDDWFERGVTFVRAALSSPGTKVLIHCHMGVNRGPSMGFAALLAGGLDPIEAMTVIRAARPIAGVIYAPSALDWWLRHNNASDDTRAWAAVELMDWMDANEVDVAWVVNRIWRAGWAA